MAGDLSGFGSDPGTETSERTLLSDDFEEQDGLSDLKVFFNDSKRLESLFV